MKRKSFTLVEILVVIGVIAILMGILFPTLGVIRSKANHRQSQTEAKNIRLAVKSFNNDYQYMPDTTTGNDVVYYGSKAKGTNTASNEKCSDIFKEDDTLQQDYIDLFSTLCYQKPTGAVSPTGDSDKPVRDLNPRKIKFLEPTKKYAKEGGYRDPWGRPYVIYLDTNRDGQISLPGGKIIYDDVAVIGLGSYDYETNDKISNILSKSNQIVTSWE